MSMVERIFQIFRRTRIVCHRRWHHLRVSRLWLAEGTRHLGLWLLPDCRGLFDCRQFVHPSGLAVCLRTAQLYRAEYFTVAASFRSCRRFVVAGDFGGIHIQLEMKTWSNKSLQATRDGALSSASRFTLVGPACLALDVRPHHAHAQKTRPGFLR